jgi:chromosomal replication initiator protein
MGTVSRIAPTWLRNKNFYLKNILYRDGVEIPEEIIEYVAQHQIERKRTWRSNNIPDCSVFFNKKVTIELAKSVVEKFVKNVKREISIDYIQKTVSDYFQLDLECYNQKQEKDT